MDKQRSINRRPSPTQSLPWVEVKNAWEEDLLCGTQNTTIPLSSLIMVRLQTIYIFSSSLHLCRLPSSFLLPTFASPSLSFLPYSVIRFFYIFISSPLFFLLLISFLLFSSHILSYRIVFSLILSSSLLRFPLFSYSLPLSPSCLVSYYLVSSTAVCSVCSHENRRGRGYRR